MRACKEEEEEMTEQGMFVCFSTLLLEHNIGFSWECVLVYVHVHFLQVRSSLFHNPPP